MDIEVKVQTHVRVIIYNDNGEILLLRRSPHNQRAVGQFELPGGKLDEGEEALACARRELNEETGIVCELEPQGEVEVPIDPHLVFRTQLFVGNCADMAIKISDEHDEFQWITLQEIQHKNVTKATKKIIQFVINKEITEKKEEGMSDNVEKNATKIEELIVQTDGGSRGNPGPSASGYVILRADGSVLESGGEYLGITTNNQAEYQAVKLGLEQTRKYQPQRIHFRIDSQLIVNQMNGVYRIKNRDLWPIHASIKELMTEFTEVTFEHVYRDQNKLADAQVNLILDKHARSRS